MEQILEKAIEHFGKESQIKKTIEELTELSLALQHYVDKKVPAADVTCEMVDVYIMITQLKLIKEFNPDGKIFYEFLNEKLNKLDAKIEKEKLLTTTPTLTN